MRPDPGLPLFLAAAPAILGSILLMRSAGVGQGPIGLQAGVFLGGGALLWTMRRFLRFDAADRVWALALSGCLLLPLLVGSGPGPLRWIVLGGFRLYVAAIVLPALLLVLGRLVVDSPPRSLPFALPLAAAAVALLLQPDAAQLAACALAAVPLWLRWTAARAVKLMALALVLGCTIGVWQRPDPLPPVAHVEGVFALASGIGPLALVWAIFAALAPSAVLLGQARSASSPGLLAAALYYLALLALAPLQLTPVPLLGFGASPILGYLLLAGFAARPEAR